MSTRNLDPRRLKALQPATALWTRYRPEVAPLRFRARSKEAWQRLVRRELEKAIGFQGGQKVPLMPKRIERVDCGDYVREKVLLRTAPHVMMPVYLLYPKLRAGRLRTVIALHGHGYGAKDIVGLWEDGSERREPDGYHKDFAVALCRAGFAVAAPEIACFGERQTDFSHLDQAMGQGAPTTCAHTAMLALHEGGSVLGMRVRDGRRLIDWLETRRELDTRRLGAMGISGGGMHAFFLTCVDPRIRACVVSGYYCTFRDSILAMAHCACNFVPGLWRFGEMYDLVGLIAPRPMLVEAGHRDPIFPIGAVKKSVKRARSVYRAFGAEDAVATDYFHGRHQISGRKAYGWLASALLLVCFLIAAPACVETSEEGEPPDAAGVNLRRAIQYGPCAEKPSGHASKAALGPYVMVDQFGYRPEMSKVAVLVTPHVGLNAGDVFAPGATYELRTWATGDVVLSGAITAWNGGAVQDSSGDSGSWFDFGAVRDPGGYYVYDPTNGVRSGCFEIGPDVYKPVLAAAMRMFFYQRSGCAKEVPHADARWTDAAAYVGSGQDREARSSAARDDASTARDVSGGWFDAGDLNKYVNYAGNPVHQLLTAYTENPAAFGDDTNIPESGNAVPDVLDEARWEIDWFVRMQQDDGGELMKVGVLGNAAASPPSTDRSPRYYVPACTSSTIVAAGVFAHAALVFAPFDAAYADDLGARAVRAWQWYAGRPAEESCDVQGIQATRSDLAPQDQTATAVTAAVYLFARTGAAEYADFVAANLATTWPFTDSMNRWSSYNPAQGDALLFFAKLPNADPAVQSSILNTKTNEALSTPEIYPPVEDDLYRAFMGDWGYHWGSNSPRANTGSTAYDMVQYGLAGVYQKSFVDRASGILGYFHGVNPLGMVYLTHMDEHGAQKSANEIFHTWFASGTSYSDALTSLQGPAPGYVPGGPNPQYNGSSRPPRGEPPQKAYRDWNGTRWSSSYKDESWEITEPSLSYQGAYVKLLSKFVGRPLPE